MYDLSPIYDLAPGSRYQPSGRGRRLKYVTASALMWFNLRKTLETQRESNRSQSEVVQVRFACIDLQKYLHNSIVYTDLDRQIIGDRNAFVSFYFMPIC